VNEQTGTKVAPKTAAPEGYVPPAIERMGTLDELTGGITPIPNSGYGNAWAIG
jgi:hypothetical protein